MGFLNSVEDWIFGKDQGDNTTPGKDDSTKSASSDAMRSEAYGPKTDSTADAAKPSTDKNSGFFSKLDGVFDMVFAGEKKTEVSAKTDSTGQVTEVTQKTDRGTTTLDANHNLKHTDAGGTIERQGNGDIDSKSADGTKSYHRDAKTGDQHFEDTKKGITADYNHDRAQETAPDGSKHEQVRVGDLTGSWHTTTDGRQFFQSDKPFKSVKPEDLKEGVVYAFSDKDTGDKELAVKKDGILRVFKPDSVEFVFQNGARMVRDDHGHITYFDDKHHDGVQLTRENFEEVRSMLPEHLRHSLNVHNDQFDIGGARIRNRGAVETDDGDTVKQDHDSVSLTTKKGETIAASHGGVTTLECPHGFKSVQEDHKNTITDERPGHSGEQLFNYDFTSGSLVAGNPSNPDIDFTDQGTSLGWNDLWVGDDGSIEYSDGSYLYDDSDDATYDSADATAHAVVEQAGATADAVTNDINLGTVYDTTDLEHALGDLSGALSQCLSSGNMDAAERIIAAMGEIEPLIGPAQKKAEEARELQSLGFGSFGIAQAEKDDYGYTAEGIVEKMKEKSNLDR